MKEDLEFTLSEIKSIGINQIEVSRMPIHAQTAMWINQYQISVCSIQLTMHKLFNDSANIIAFAKAVNTNQVVVSVLPWWAHLPRFGMKTFIKKMHELLGIYEKEGIHVSFHHHAYEMKHQILSVLDHKLDKRIGFILDTYWITSSQQDPLVVYQTYSHRVRGIHLRDYLDGHDATPGQGKVDFKKLLDHILEPVYTVIEEDAQDPLIAVEEAKLYLEGLL
jgi:sugar phosphate isomerase/epimerase